MKTLFFGGPILTMDDPLYVQSLLVEDGKIVAAGSLDQLRPMAQRQIDLQGAALLPAFLDAHSHFTQVAFAQMQVSLDGISSTEEMRNTIQEFIQRTKPTAEQWIQARDYDNNLMPGLQNPTLSDLDSFSPDHPLVIHHKSGHMGLMNSKALSLLGIAPQTEAPSGGKIGVQNGQLTGYLEENAFFTYLKKVPMPGPETLLRSYAQAQQVYASYGITTVQDGMVAAQMLPLYELLTHQPLKLDVITYAEPSVYDPLQTLLLRQDQGGRLRLGGMKIFLDGSPQGRTAWMRQPYAGSDYTGYGTMTDEAVEDAMILAGQKGVQLLAHCNGDGAAEQFLRCLERAEEKIPALSRLRPVIIHGQLMGLDQLSRAATLGAMASFFVAHVYHWGDVHLQNFGPKRAANISPAASALQAGLPFTFHQDAPVIPPNMLETVWCAAARQTKNGRCLGPEQAISVLDALRAVTILTAWQYGLSNQQGSLSAGKSADLVILDRDPLQTPLEDLRSIQILSTWKEGTCIYQA